MAPESNSTSTSSATEREIGKSIAVPSPTADQSVTVETSPGGNLTLSFDPSAAEPTRDGNDLVMQTEDGGRVVMSDFFAVGENALPTFTLPDGTVVDATDLLEASGVDLTTAAGPSGSGGEGGGTSYADDPGNLIDGTDKLGKLGTFHWNRATDPDIDMVNGEERGGDFGFGSGFAMIEIAYEDGKAGQNATGEGGTATAYQELHMAFHPKAGNTAQTVRFESVEHGTFYVRDSSGGYQEVFPKSGPNGPYYEFDASEFNAPGTDFNGGVYFVPGADTSENVSLEITVTFKSPSGALTPAHGSGHIEVLAVADLADVKDASITTDDMELQAGTAMDKFEIKTNTDGSVDVKGGEATRIPVAVSAAFTDTDGSEQMFVEIKGVPNDWTVYEGELPTGWTIAGKVDNGDGTYTLRVDVTEDPNAVALAAGHDSEGANALTVDGSIIFNPHDWTSSYADDASAGRSDAGGVNTGGPAELELRVVTVDTDVDSVGPDGQPYTDTAETEWMPLGTVDLVEDVPVFTSSNVSLAVNEAAGQQTGEEAFADLPGAVQSYLNGLAGGTPLGVDRIEDGVRFNLFSDGVVDGEVQAGGVDGDTAPSLAWETPPAMFAKLPDSLVGNVPGANAQGYAPVTFTTETGPNGEQYLVGRFSYIDGSGNPQSAVALVGVMEPNYAGGTANISFVQYNPVMHADGNGLNTLTNDFTIRITDNDGDSTTTNVRFTVTDTVAVANDDGTVTLNEVNDTVISGNVLLNDVAGSDGWASDGAGAVGGVVGYEVNGLPAGYTMTHVVDGAPATANMGDMQPGTVYTVLTDQGTVQGTFTLQANGDWSFDAGDNNIVKDFNPTITYTVQDADGDQDTANLALDVKAAPLVVTLTGDPHVYESPAEGETHSFAEYVIGVKDWNGSAATGEYVSEEITVTLNVDFNGAAAADFVLNGIEYKDAEGNWQTTTVTTHADGSGFAFDVPIPAGSLGDIQFRLPINDDSSGGKLGANANDNVLDGFNVSIADVSSANDVAVTPAEAVALGNTAAADYSSSQATVIVDDGTVVSGGSGGWEYGTDNNVDSAGFTGGGERALDGPVFDLNSTGIVKEGSSAKFTLSAENPAGGAYTDVLEESVTITLQVTRGENTEAADMGNIVSLSGLPAGASVECNTAAGTVTIRLSAGFNMNDIGKVGFNVSTRADNIEEKGEVEDFAVNITGSTGNESAYHGNAITTVINDVYNNTLEISGGQTLYEGGTQVFTLTYNTSALLSNGTDTIKVTLDFGGTATPGEDFTLDAIRGANPGVEFVDPVMVDGVWTGQVTVVIEQGDWTADTTPERQNHGDGSLNYYNNTLNINVPTAHDNVLFEKDETITVTIVATEGGEIAKTSGLGSGTVIEDGSLDLSFTDGSIGTNTITENVTDANGNVTNISTYQVNFKHDAGTGAGSNAANIASGAGDIAGSEFKFDLTLTNKTAKFDSDMTDNFAISEDGTTTTGTDAATGDYGWAVGGQLFPYDSLAESPGSTPGVNTTAQQELIDAINAELAQTNPGITVVDISKDGRTLTFHVEEGADLSRPMPIQVGAIDDRITEGNENFKITLSNISTEADTHLSISGNNTLTTNITDDAGTRTGDGFSVGLGPMAGAESSGRVDLNVHIFQRDGNGNIIEADPDNPPSQNITVKVQVTSDAPGDPVGNADINSDFYLNGPKGENTHTVTLGHGTANWEFVDASGSEANGDYVPAHWHYKGNDAFLPVNDDRLSEGTEDFTVSVQTTTGHESNPLAQQFGDIGSSTDKATITDDYALGDLDGPALVCFGPSEPVREPVATSEEGMTLDGTPANVPVNTIDYKVGMSCDVAEDTIVFIKIDPSSDFNVVTGDGLNGTLGVVNSGNIADLIAKYPALENYDPSSFDANGAGYFVIIPKGEAATTFQVQIVHDHDSSVVGGVDNPGVDNPGEEDIRMEITSIVGSENTFNAVAEKAANGEVLTAKEQAQMDLKVSTETIQDDNEGPAVTLEAVGKTTDGDGIFNGFECTVNVAVPCAEDVRVQVTVADSNGTQTGYITIPAGDTTATGKLLDAAGNPLNLPAGGYFYTQVEHSVGGETDAISDPILTTFGSGPGVPLGVNISAEPIYEGGVNGTQEPVSVTYDIAITRVEDFSGNDGFRFTINPLHASSSPDDLAGNSSVTIDMKQSFLTDIAGGKDFTMSVVPDVAPGAAGNPVKVIVIIDGDTGNPVELTIGVDGTVSHAGNDYGTITGNLPTANDDNRIEPTETFTPIISDSKGVIPTDVNKVEIIDNDKPTIKVVFCDANGNELTPEAVNAREGGSDVYVKVVLVDADGEPLTLGGDGPADFRLGSDGSGSAKENTDFILEKSTVTIPQGGSESTVVKVHLPDDFKSDGDVTMSIQATYEDGQGKINNYSDCFDASNNTSAPVSVIIAENINGPEITFTHDKSTIGENGSVNYWVTLDTALEEDATLTFKVDLAQGSTADGFVLDDIKSITVDGKEYFLSVDENDALVVKVGGIAVTNSPISMDGGGNLLIDMGMANGTSKEGFKITLNNDVITEGRETLSVSLVDTEGGELLYNGAEVGAGTGPSLNTTVTDVLDGPQIGLVALPNPGGEEGETVSIGLTLSKATISDTPITLELGAGVADNVVEGNTFTVHVGNTEITGTISADGKASFTLPAGVPAGTLQIEFPLQDNAKSETTLDDFKVSLSASGIGGGETSLASALSYGCDFVSETDSTMVVKLEGPTTVNASAECSLTLSGVNMAHVARVTFTLDGKTYTYEPGGVNDSLSVNGDVITVDGKVGVSLNGVNVTVTYDRANMTPEQIANAKLDTTVTAKLTGMELTVAITEDANDGPTFTVTGGTGGAEGADVHFTIETGLSTGDAFTTTEEPITLNFQLTGPFATTGVTVAVMVNGSPVDVPATYDAGTKTFSVEIPTGADVSENLAVTVPTTSDTLVGTEKTVGITLTDVKGGEAELGTDKVESVNVIEGDTAEVTITEGTHNLNEGGSIALNLALVNAVSGGAMTATQAMTVTIMIEAAEGTFNTASFPNGTTASFANGVYTITTTLPTGGTASLNLPLADNAVIGETNTVQVTGATVDAGSLPVAAAAALGGGSGAVHDLVDNDASVATAAGADGDYTGMTLTANTTAGGTHVITDTNGATVAILGNAAANTITGSDGADNIYAGAGDDVVRGSGGSDALFGGDGKDLLDYSGLGFEPGENGLSFNLADANQTVTYTDTTGAESWTDSISGFEAYQGTSGNDQFFGGDAGETIYGGAGDDIIYGGAGDDVLTGGEGSDVFAWTANDFGYAGNPFGDIITDFEFGQGGDQLAFENLFNDTQISQGVGAGNLTDGVSFTAHGDDYALQATWNAEQGLTVNITDGTGQSVQTIAFEGTDNANFGDNFADGADDFAAMVQQMILTNSGNI